MAYLALRLLSMLPLPLLHGLGVGLGWLMWLWPGRHQDRVRGNLAQSGLLQAKRGLLRQVVQETGKGLVELAVVWLRPQEKLVRLVREVRGNEHFERAMQSGRGVIVIGPHVGCFEMVSQYVAAQQRCTVMYKPARDPTLDRLMRQGRERGQARLVRTDLSGVKALLGALRRGEAIGVLPDHVATQGDGVWAPFFGRWAYTPTLTMRLIRTTGAIPLMAYVERLSWGRGYRLHFDPVDLPVTEDRLAAATALNREVERVAAKLPEQYMWSYARYKRPGGVEPPPETPAA
jgi:KDO2-lipid IV(A) lauroyltransferase